MSWSDEDCLSFVNCWIADELEEHILSCCVLHGVLSRMDSLNSETSIEFNRVPADFGFDNPLLGTLLFDTNADFGRSIFEGEIKTVNLRQVVVTGLTRPCSHGIKVQLHFSESVFCNSS